MKSMYRELIQRREVYNILIEMGWWKRLWKLQVHKRLKLILWKLLWDVFPTKCRIADRDGVCDDGEIRCVLCGEADESTHHLLLECLVSQILWCHSPWGLDIRTFAGKPLSDWLLTMLDPSTLPSLAPDDYHLFQLYALISWDIIWWTRNQIIHNEAKLDVLHMPNRVNRLCREHLGAWRQKKLAQLAQWIPPTMGSVKVNFDVAMGAAVIRDHSGMFVGAAVQQFQVTDSLVGEVRAAHLGVEEALRCDFSGGDSGESPHY